MWGALERHWKPMRQKGEGAGPMSGTLHLAQAQSNRGPQGRKKDFPGAERLVKRLVAHELTLSFVPDAEQRLWRTVMRRKYQLRRNRVQLHNRLESLLEEAHIKLSSLVSDLRGASARRRLTALADGETNPATVAALADRHLRATQEQLCELTSSNRQYAERDRIPAPHQLRWPDRSHGRNTARNPSRPPLRGPLCGFVGGHDP